MLGAAGRRIAELVPRAIGSSGRGFSTRAATGYQARLSQHYHNTLRDDLMILQYVPPSVRARQEDIEQAQLQAMKDNAGGTPPSAQRQRQKMRPLRPAQAESAAHNTAYVDKVTVHIRCREALNNKHHLLSSLMALQVIAGQRAEVVKAKNDAAPWKLRKGMPIAAKVELTGDRMYEFLDKLVEVVLPRMKEYSGLRMDAGDGSGSFTLGFDNTAIGLFPEMEMVYDMFPLVTGFAVNISTTAGRNPAGRLLLSGLNVPFLHARKVKDESFML
ncbi:ribosomal protein [Coemansia thaxteri]|uniref:Ribosomal protein n=1 Tax=Coemansia thaxteri TaxID=2663907 RepID=A0A9W8EIB8_9FUNG|nr:ribosomal protein [Coemansia thaxteri]KAJ2003989.1 ribosomal protein [Coemansia thaxteri]KAJ2473399.1 ribosomal protein [Coemansia sp. RSA 2322]KAJ2480091.1 ribosomal protein [Coemansia sp. RSA 2320]